jgi:hypothetical protein
MSRSVAGISLISLCLTRPLQTLPTTPPLRPGGLARRAAPALPGRMHVDQPKHWHPALRRGGQRTMRRHVRDKGRSAVDRVQHPDILGVRRHILPFLTRDAVLGKRSAIISRSPPWALR